MARIAGKPTVKASVKALVVKSKSFEEFKTEVQKKGTDKFTEIEMFKLWNRRAAFRRELESKKAAKKPVETKKPAAKKAKAGKKKAAKKADKEDDATDPQAVLMKNLGKLLDSTKKDLDAAIKNREKGGEKLSDQDKQMFNMINSVLSRLL
jgi:hypothetical protein